MTQLELIELVQQHHPTMGHTEIRLGINRAQDDYCARTELIKTSFVQNSTAGKRYYIPVSKLGIPNSIRLYSKSLSSPFTIFNFLFPNNWSINFFLSFSNGSPFLHCFCPRHANSRTLYYFFVNMSLIIIVHCSCNFTNLFY